MDTQQHILPVGSCGRTTIFASAAAILGALACALKDSEKRLSALPGDDLLPAIIFALGFAGFICNAQEACIRGNPPS